jgi:hypothetical protein
MYLGVTQKSPKYNFLVSGDIVTLTGNQVMPSCADIRKARKK